jgi:hypothetical protein
MATITATVVIEVPAVIQPAFHQRDRKVCCGRCGNKLVFVNHSLEQITASSLDGLTFNGRFWHKTVHHDYQRQRTLLRIDDERLTPAERDSARRKLRQGRFSRDARARLIEGPLGPKLIMGEQGPARFLPTRVACPRCSNSKHIVVNLISAR